MIKRILVFKFKEGYKIDDINKIFKKFEDLPNKIRGVSLVDSGLEISPEGMNKGFTHVVQIHFEDAVVLDSYLPHPEHDAIKKLCKPLLKDMLILDYEI